MFFKPSSLVLSFISFTNAGTEPATRTAAAFAASFPEARSIPCAKMRKVTLSPGRSPIDEPSTATSLAFTAKLLSASVCSSAISAVIILVVLAIGRRSSLL